MSSALVTSKANTYLLNKSLRDRGDIAIVVRLVEPGDGPRRCLSDPCTTVRENIPTTIAAGADRNGFDEGVRRIDPDQHQHEQEHIKPHRCRR